jgi:hypothetical protein
MMQASMSNVEERIKVSPGKTEVENHMIQMKCQSEEYRLRDKKNR